MSSSNPTDCRWPLDNSTSATFILPDGRKLGFAEYGTSSGRPVIYLPGFPAGRLEGALLHHAASNVGARIIAIDRPGYGWSSPQPDRTILTHAKDVEALADHLKLHQYGVLGISGGGPYALACARSLPADKLRVVSLVCGLGLPDMGYWGMKWTNWMGWAFVQRLMPGFCRWWFSREPGARLDLSEEERMKRIQQAFEKSKGKMHPKDQKHFGDPDFMTWYLRFASETYAQGMDGMSLDFKLLNSDPGFKIEDIRKDLPVQLLYAKLDENVPLQHGQKIAKRLGGNAQLKVYDDDTHVSISQDHKEEYLRALVTVIEA